MKDYLESLEIGEGKIKLSEEEIKNILAENGKIVKVENQKIEKNLNEKIKTYKTTIANLESQLENVPDSKELEGLKKEIADMKTAEQTRIANEKAEQEDKILTNNILNVFGERKFTSDYVKNGLIADIKSELNKTENKGRGISDIFESLTKDKAGLFENPNQPTAMPSMGEQDNSISKDMFDKMSYMQRVSLKQENPSLYQELSK